MARHSLCTAPSPTDESVGEAGGALLEECGHRLWNRGRVNGHYLLSVFVLDCGPLGGDLKRRPHPLFGQANAPRGERGDLTGSLESTVEHSAVVFGADGQADAL